MGGDLDIAYQSAGMKIGEQANVTHYGLSGNPHVVILSKKRLKKAFPPGEFTFETTLILSYQPLDDMILVQMEITSEGLRFKPILDYQVVQP